MVIVNTRILEGNEKKEKNFAFNSEEIITLLPMASDITPEGEGVFFVRRFNVLMIYLCINIVFESSPR